MGGTTLVSKGILGPIEGSVVFHETELPLLVDAQVSDMSVDLPDVIIAEAYLPHEVTAEVETFPLGVEVEVPLLDVNAELED